MMMLLRAALVLACVPLLAFAQAISQIQGTITDSTGAAIAGADIKATQTDTGIVRAIASGNDGVYVLSSLPIGPYRLEVAKTGFSTFVQSGIVLQVGTSPTVDVSMKVGEVATQVQVEANAALIDTQGTSVGSVIENKRILELPLNGRNPVELIQLAGAAIPAGTNGTAGFPGGLNISIAGGLPSGVGYNLDGTAYSNPFDGVNLPFPFPDALQEFKVETSSLTAQNGTHASGAVNASVKSGTNNIHGNLFEFFRNGQLNARNFFASRRDTLKRNQFGGTLGGPIKKNKIFFFGGYQGTYTRSDPADRVGFVPSAAMLTGDLSQCSTLPATIRDPLSTTSPQGIFPGKQVPLSRFSQQSLNVIKLLPSSSDACGRTTFGPVVKTNEHQGVGRLDYQLSDRQSLFGRYMMTTYRKPAPFDFSRNVLDTTDNGFDNVAQTYALGHTFLIKPTVVNTFRFAANRVNVYRFNADYFSFCDVGVRNWFCFVPHQTVMTVTGGPAIGAGTGIDASFIPTYFTFSDDVNLIRGNHQIAVGLSMYKYQHSQKANVFSAGSLAFAGLTGLGSSGNGMADFLMGVVSSVGQGSPNTVFANKWYAGTYIQDTWKASRRLTVNAGVRWEPFLPQGFNNGAIYTYSVDRMRAGVRSTVFKNAPAGLLYSGDAGFDGKTGSSRRYNQFAPRVGLSFDPGGDQKTVIRVAAGIAYDFPNVQIASTPATAPPFGNAITGVPGPAPFADPWSIYPGGNPFPGNFGGPDSAFVRGNYMAVEPDAKATTVYSWNASIQHQFGGDLLLSATYMGNQMRHIWGTKQLNPAVILNCGTGVAVSVCNTTGNVDARRISAITNPSAGGGLLSYVDSFDSGGTGNYHGLLLAMAKRMSRNVSFQANYTWSHCIADINAASWVGGVGLGLLDPNNRAFDRGNCQTMVATGLTQSLDRRHIANITAVYETPKISTGMVRRAVSDWRISTSIRANSGSFVTPTLGTDGQRIGAGGGTLRPNQIAPTPLTANHGSQCAGIATTCIAWLDPSSFQVAADYPVGSLPNLGRSSVPGPAFWQMDMAVSRIFRLKEAMSLEARGEAFNLTNAVRWGNPTLGRNSPQFGQILSAQDPRIMQLALKFVF